MGEHTFVSTREAIAEFAAAGMTGAEIARRVGVSPATVCYHLRRLGYPPRQRHRRYDWAEIQRYYDAGHSIRECQRRFGFARKTWHDATATDTWGGRNRRAPVVELAAG